jgi:methionyl aminopeptidase
MGILKNNTDQRLLKEAAQIAGSVCDELINNAQPGMSTVTLEQLANRLLGLRRSLAPFKDFDGFGHACCISLNEEIVNGPPSRERILKEGDLVSIAVGSNCRGVHGKAARTAYLGNSVPSDIERLLAGTQAVFHEISKAPLKPQTLKDLVALIAQSAADHDLRIIKGSGGAGIGKALHDNPYIHNIPEELTQDVDLVPGMAFTLMPMMTLGSGAWFVHEDGWTHITEDSALAAHFAETLLVTEAGVSILST